MTIRPVFARVLLSGGIAFFGMLTTAPAVMAACSDPAGPQVDWSGCDKTNAILFEANLTGADLTRAGLADATLTGADPTGADLTGANLTEVNLNSALLTGATWTDGRVCAQGSIEVCNSTSRPLELGRVITGAL